MKVAIGADHLGFNLKALIKTLLESEGYEVGDIGCFNMDMCDYVDYAECVAKLVGRGLWDRGILVCGSGIGMSIAANKIAGVRAALCHDVHAAIRSREHNDANVLCLSADDTESFNKIVGQFMLTKFEGGRHQARLDKIAGLEG